MPLDSETTLKGYISLVEKNGTGVYSSNHDASNILSFALNGRDTIYRALAANIKNIPTGFRFVTEGPGVIFDILLNAHEEGVVKATVTATASSGATVGTLVLIFGVGALTGPELLAYFLTSMILGYGYSKASDFLYDKTVDAFNQALTTNIPGYDPLVFDLDNDGKISLTDIESGRNFDIDNDGFAQKTAWVDKGDGILCLDRNGNGVIDNGLELFGENTLLDDGTYAKGGIEALAELDSNKDGIIDNKDKMFNSLGFLKKDGSFLSITDTNIVRIKLNYADISNKDEYGNTQVKSAAFIVKEADEYGNINEVEREYGEFLLNQNHTRSIPLEWIDVSKDVAELPEIMYQGWVHTLQQTIMNEINNSDDNTSTLQALITQFSEETDRNIRINLMDDILYHWAGVEDVSTTERGMFDARKLSALEKFLGRYFMDNPDSTVVNHLTRDHLNDAWDSLVNTMYDELMVQTHLKGVYDSFTYSFTGSFLNVDFNEAVSYLNEIIVSDTSADKQVSKDIVKDLGASLNDLGYIPNINLGDFIEKIEKIGSEYALCFTDAIGSDLITGTDGDDTISDTGFYDKNVILYGKGGNDKLFAFNGDDIVYTGEGDNQVLLQKGDDIVYIGNGVNDIRGGEGKNTYIIEAGKDITSNNGKATISYSFGKDDSIVFKGIKSDEVSIKTVDVNSTNINIEVKFKNNPNYSVLIKAQDGGSWTVENWVFEDKSFTFQEIVDTYLSTIYGTDGDDNITISKWTNITHAGKGNDTINGSSRADIIYGDDGNDVIYGKEGDDIIYGGVGNDELFGDQGDDIYVFKKGDGTDRISEKSGNDTIRIEGVSKEDIAFFKDGNSLYIKYGDKDEIKVDGNFSKSDWNIERYEIDNNLYMTNVDINNLIQDMTAYAQEKGIVLNSVNDVKNNQELMQLLSSHWQG